MRTQCGKGVHCAVSCAAAGRGDERRQQFRCQCRILRTSSMKNFSTVVHPRCSRGARRVLLLAGPVQAAECSFKPNAPDQHRVVKGDTLWDISGAFLEHPWCWPQVWGMNREEIRNPHWIYPGQVVYFDRARGRLSLTKPGGGDGGDAPLLRLSPQVRTEGTGTRCHRRHPGQHDRALPDPAAGDRKGCAGRRATHRRIRRQPLVSRHRRPRLCARRRRGRDRIPGVPSGQRR